MQEKEEHLKGIAARVVQHEYDHLFGKLISDHGKCVSPFVSQKQFGRNDPCPCGSNKKYKKCCGANTNG